MSATPPVPEGDVDIPLLTGLANTIEWLSDYPEFYQKRLGVPLTKVLPFQ